jgi:hypothetical protein
VLASLGALVAGGCSIVAGVLCLIVRVGSLIAILRGPVAV